VYSNWRAPAQRSRSTAFAPTDEAARANAKLERPTGAVWVGYIALYGVAVQTGVVMVVYLHEALDQAPAEG
jgi:hypothetical protein